MRLKKSNQKNSCLLLFWVCWLILVCVLKLQLEFLLLTMVGCITGTIIRMDIMTTGTLTDIRMGIMTTGTLMDIRMVIMTILTKKTCFCIVCFYTLLLMPSDLLA
jgi:hypothetical protein